MIHGRLTLAPALLIAGLLLGTAAATPQDRTLRLVAFGDSTTAPRAGVKGVWADRLRFRVWERGAGITRACGSGACAALVTAARRGVIAGRRATVVLDGGELDIEWRDDGHVVMTGPVATSFRGELDASLAP